MRTPESCELYQVTKKDALPVSGITGRIWQIDNIPAIDDPDKIDQVEITIATFNGSDPISGKKLGDDGYFPVVTTSVSALSLSLGEDIIVSGYANYLEGRNENGQDDWSKWITATEIKRFEEK